MTAMLGFIIIYIYSAVAFIFLFDTFYDDQVHAGLLNRKGDSICQSMMHCFLSTINYGLRGGGGIGEFLPTQTAAAENRQGFYFRSAYDLTFFLLVLAEGSPLAAVPGLDWQANSTVTATAVKRRTFVIIVMRKVIACGLACRAPKARTRNAL